MTNENTNNELNEANKHVKKEKQLFKVTYTMSKNGVILPFWVFAINISKFVM